MLLTPAGTHLDPSLLTSNTQPPNPSSIDSAILPTRLPSVGPQKFRNGEIHNWYRIVLGYSDHLVSQLLDEFQLEPGELLLDPFCGTGTTLIECMKRQIDSVGVDANPSSVFAARVKTNWELRAERLLELDREIASSKRKFLQQRSSYKNDATFRYLDSSGMIKRGWISREPLRKAIALKNCIGALQTTQPYKDVLTLALMAEVVTGASNVKFGPELYCGPAKQDADVYGGFETRVQAMAKDLGAVSARPRGAARILEGDARDLSPVLGANRTNHALYSAVICSPPYPAEHDYTRNARLELAFLEFVTDLHSLRHYKKLQIRSHTKGIYKEDKDSGYLGIYPAIEQIVEEMERNVRTKTHGFAKLYSTVVKEYFGGMKRHLQSLARFLAPGAKCAYVLGDQSAYAGVHIQNAQILASIAQDCGYEVLEIRPWRMRWSTTTSKSITENILLFRKPQTRRNRLGQDQGP